MKSLTYTYQDLGRVLCSRPTIPLESMNADRNVLVWALPINLPSCACITIFLLNNHLRLMMKL
jgi:hypothetical protein